MSSGAAIAAGRMAAEAEMTLTLTAYSPAGKTLDPDGFEVPAYANEGSVLGKVQSGSQAGKDTPTRYISIGGVERPVLSGGLHIPIAAPLPIPSEQRGIGWEYEVTAIGSSDDPALLGRRFLVVGVPIKSKATARRLDVVEV